jgi:coproporphyrinogen III oxidase
MLINSFSEERINEVVDSAKHEISKSMTTVGMKQNIRKLFDDLRDMLQDSVDITNETRRLVKAIHKKFKDEYGFKEMFMLRAGMVYEKGIFNADERLTALTGPTAGFSADIPLKKDSKRKFGVEYAYRTTNPFAGVHSIGLRLKL